MLLDYAYLISILYLNEKKIQISSGFFVNSLICEQKLKCLMFKLRASKKKDKEKINIFFHFLQIIDILSHFNYKIIIIIHVIYIKSVLVILRYWI